MTATDEQVEFSLPFRIASVCLCGLGGRGSLTETVQECSRAIYSTIWSQVGQTTNISSQAINVENCIFYALSICPVAGVDTLVDQFWPTGHNFETPGVAAFKLSYNCTIGYFINLAVHAM